MNRSLRLAAVAAAALLSLPPQAGAVSGATSQAAEADVAKQNVARVGGANNTTGGHIVFEGDRLYLGTYGRGFRIYDIADPENPLLMGGYEPGPVRADAVPDAAVFDGRHIAVLNGTRRVSHRPPLPTEGIATDRSEFLDVTDPANPVLLHTFIGQADGEAHNGDIYDAKRLWLPSGGTADNGLRIYDMQPLLDNPADPPGTSCVNGTGLGCNANDPARLFPPDDCRNDDNVKCDPVTLWERSPYLQGRPVGDPFTHTHDISIYPNYPVKQLDGSVRPRDIVLLAEGGNYGNTAGNTGSVFVIDITDPANPVVLLRWLHERGPNHHPIRYHHEAQFLDGDPSVMLVTDENLDEGCRAPGGGAVAVRLSEDLTSATELSEWYIPAATPAPWCSVHVFSSANDLAFFGSYNAGLQVVDYSDPSRPRRAGFFIAEGTTAWGAYFYRGYVYQGDMTRGLDVFRYLGPGAAKPAGQRATCPGSKQGRHFVGTPGNDVLVGGPGRDVLCGLGGNDKIRGKGGNDVLTGGKGNDRLRGGRAKDLLLGGPGRGDRLHGGKHFDRCHGGPKDRAPRACEEGLKRKGRR